MGDKEIIPSLGECSFEEENTTQVRDATPVSQVPPNEEREEASLEYLVKKIEEITGYKFSDPILLLQAFTHYSFQEGCSSFETLAYFGDGILSHIVMTDQYSSYKNLDRGKLTEHRAANINTEKLARAALKNELHKFLRCKINQFTVQIEEFEKELKEYPLLTCGLIDVPKVLADIVESLIEVIFIDSGFDIKTTSEATKKLLEPMITPDNAPKHPRTQLQEFCQQNQLTLEKNENFWNEEGVMEFIVNGRIVGRGRHKVKNIAKNRAALDAYSQC